MDENKTNDGHQHINRFLDLFDKLVQSKDWDKAATLVTCMFGIVDEDVEESGLTDFTQDQFDDQFGRFQALVHSYVDPEYPGLQGELWDCDMPDERAEHLWFKALVQSAVDVFGLKKVKDMLFEFIDQWCTAEPKDFYTGVTIDEIINAYNDKKE